MRWECRHVSDHERHGTYHINDIVFTECIQNAVPQALAAVSANSSIQFYSQGTSHIFCGKLDILTMDADEETHMIESHSPRLELQYSEPEYVHPRPPRLKGSSHLNHQSSWDCTYRHTRIHSCIHSFTFVERGFCHVAQAHLNLPKKQSIQKPAMKWILIYQMCIHYFQQKDSLSSRLECCGTIKAHCEPNASGSTEPPVSASQHLGWPQLDRVISLIIWRGPAFCWQFSFKLNGGAWELAYFPTKITFLGTQSLTHSLNLHSRVDVSCHTAVGAPHRILVVWYSTDLRGLRSLA
ncbi:hypothetical protein AAY473_040129 [Plecturocebus cupreus]